MARIKFNVVKRKGSSTIRQKLLAGDIRKLAHARQTGRRDSKGTHQLLKVVKRGLKLWNLKDPRTGCLGNACTLPKKHKR